MLGTTYLNSDLLTLSVNDYYNNLITGYCQPF